MKIDIVDYIRVCKTAKLLEVLNSKTHAHKSRDGKEGIEIINGVIHTFAIKTNIDKTQEKVDDQPIQDKDICAVIGAFEERREEVKEEKALAKAHDNLRALENFNKEGSGIVEGNPNCIPEILDEKRIITPQDIKAWEKISVFERILWFQKTNPALIKKRRGFLLPEFAGRDKKTLTDDNYKMFAYIPINTMRLSANIAFCFKWTAVVEETHWFPDEVAVRGYFEVEIDGKLYQRPCAGSCVKKGIMDWGDTIEGAISEMEKRGIYNFLHGDVKRGDIEEVQ